jgi:hypothetical protein
MVSQYPNTINLQWSLPPTEDDEGYPVKGATQSYDSSCRTEENGSGKMISSSADGSLVNFQYTVYMQVPAENIPVGASVTLNLFGQVIKTTVKHYKQGFFNARIWL